MVILNTNGKAVNDRGADPDCWKCKGQGFTLHRKERRDCFCITGDKHAEAEFYRMMAKKSRHAFMRLMNEYNQALEMGDEMTHIIQQYRKRLGVVPFEFEEGDGI